MHEEQRPLYPVSLSRLAIPKKVRLDELSLLLLSVHEETQAKTQSGGLSYCS